MSSFKRIHESLLVAVALLGGLSSSQNVTGIYHVGLDVAPCSSPLFCYGSLLHEIQLARPFTDSKTFVDMATTRSQAEVEAAFALLPRPIVNDSVLQNFLAENFQPAGSEIIPVDLTEDPPAFLDEINDKVIAEFVGVVAEKWNLLTRQYNESSVCETCETSFLPPKRPFVVAGGRFREMYYWDSYWIIQGLLRSGGNFTEISKNQILNFLDYVEEYGFVPNGGRKYYLNRSQPPLLPQMVREYVDYTGDTSILERAIPLLIKEHEFFTANRSVTVEKNGTTYTLNQFNVDNNQPRPESYREDYEQVTNASFYSTSGAVYDAPALSDVEKNNLYKNLASGAESGWDFSSRFLSRPIDAVEDTTFPLRSYDIVNVIPVELNSFLYWNEVTIAGFLANTSQPDSAESWEQKGRDRRAAIHAVFWNTTRNGYFDFNLTSQEQIQLSPRDADSLPIDYNDAPTEDTQIVFHVGQLIPFLTGAADPSVSGDPGIAQRAFTRIVAHLEAFQGGVPATNLRTEQQWDQPNSWPPHMQLLIDALLRLGKQTSPDYESWEWARYLALRLGIRYLESTYCTWRGTGGSTPSSPPDPDLDDATLALGGLMFEKYSDRELNQAGGGGEYEVVVGFGWSNGVLIWVADTFRNEFPPLDCTRWGEGN